jgi:hydrogenase maturation protein HypF
MASVLAVGAYLKNSALLWQHARWTASAPHGDLSAPEACTALEASLERLLAAAGGHVDAVAHDLHPDFHSTRLAWALAARLGVPAIGVQHHLAHIGVALAEHAEAAPAIGIALDGFGLGDDGQAWGGELLQVSGGHALRVGHLRPLPLPGGDQSARQPWRLAASALHSLGRGDEIEARFAGRVGAVAAQCVHGMLARRLNCPPSSGAGRWFDAAAGALGLCDVQREEAEAPMAMEAAAARCAAPAQAMLLPADDGVIDLRPLFIRLFELADEGLPATGARLFHDSLADTLAVAAQRAASHAGIGTVVLGGGCFVNRLLRERLMRRLQSAGLRVMLPRPENLGDAGLALGQAWVAAQRLSTPQPAPLMPPETQICA